jgi:hypothetical protein
LRPVAFFLFLLLSCRRAEGTAFLPARKASRSLLIYQTGSCIKQVKQPLLNGGKFLFHNPPGQNQVNIKIFMNQDIPHPSDLFPRNIRIL